MARLFGKEMTRREILRNAGNLSQVAGARSVELLAGRGGGCKAVEVSTGGGLEFTVLQDRCLDILNLRYKGVNLSFTAKAGAVAPQHCDARDQFPYYFQGGLVYTCGLRNAGAGGDDEGEHHPLHGRISSAPAENFGVSARWEGDEYLINIAGEMRESALFRENLALRRSVETRLGANSFKITDRVDNENCLREALMYLYHINFGFPFLGPGLRLLLPKGAKTRPRDEDGAKGMSAFRSFEPPVDGYREQVFYHEMPSLPGGDTCVLLKNDALGIAVWIKYNVDRLPVTTEWKCMASGDYALGIEPANCHVEGKAKERREGTLKFLEPFGSAEFWLEIGVLEGAEIGGFIRECGLNLE